MASGIQIHWHIAVGIYSPVHKEPHIRLLASEDSPRREVAHEGFEFLRTGIAAGSSIPEELMKKLHKILNLTELTICYGMTETSPVSAMTTTDDPLDKRISTVGRLMPHVEAKVVDPADRSKILPINTRGELAVSGYLLMKEYWNDPDRTAEVMIADQEGKIWMHVSHSPPSCRSYFLDSQKVAGSLTEGNRLATKPLCHRMATSRSRAV